MNWGTSNKEAVTWWIKASSERWVTMDNVMSFHVMYVLRTYKVIHIFLAFILLFCFVFVCGLWGCASLLPVWPVVSAQFVPLAPVTKVSPLWGSIALCLCSCSYDYYNIVHFLINTATCQWKVMGEVLCEPVCMLCFSSLLYKYRITVLFDKLNSSCVSHVK